MQPFADACVASPVGAALLAELERRQRRNRTRIIDDPASDAQLVAAATNAVQRTSFGAMCELAIRASENVGPWNPDGSTEAWAAYLHVEDRRPIAEAIAARFDAELHAGVELNAQEWWLFPAGAAGVAPLFDDLDRIYENGELSWRALRAYGPTPLEVLNCGFGEAPRPLTRWALPVVGSPRVFEIHRPDDWHALCIRNPHVATKPHGTWALPGPRRDVDKDLFQLANQRAAVRSVELHLCPRWSLVARDFDAVHLSWAGFITAEGRVLTRGRHTTMLRFWEREVTMWLKDCFGDPTPITLSVDLDYFLDATTAPDRRAADETVIAAMLGRTQTS